MFPTNQIGRWMMSYGLNHQIVAALQGYERDFHTARLCHGLFHHMTCVISPGRHLPTHAFEYHARLSTLRREIGLDGSRDNRAITAGAEGLKALPIFEHLDLAPGQRSISFAPSKRWLANILPGMKVWGRFDISLIAQCRTLFDIRLYELIALHQGKVTPKFILPGIDPWTNGKRWQDSRRKWLESAVRLSAMTGNTLLFGVVDDCRTPGVPGVIVKLENAGTTWEKGCLYRFGKPVRAIEVGPGGYRALSSRETDSKRNLKRIELP